MDTKELCGRCTGWHRVGWHRVGCAGAGRDQEAGTSGVGGSQHPFTPALLLPSPDYFVDHMGDYEDVLASLETLNHSVLKAMGYTKKVSGDRAPRAAGA